MNETNGTMDAYDWQQWEGFADVRYFIAWLLGVPISVMILWMVIRRLA